ncbi:hypothetical protein GOODEAATRI_007692 [Goodea atripinnis]|uniref:Uncharacterized protein n=1 Tax=Goodea atripinnis TaxID=208336 RepID=A0ABV0MZR7_9TELE
MRIRSIRQRQSDIFLLYGLINIQNLFPSQSPTYFKMTTRETCGSQKEKDSGDLVSSRNGTKPQNVFFTIQAANNRFHCITPKTHPPPSPLTVTMEILCFPASMSRRTDSAKHQ